MWIDDDVMKRCQEDLVLSVWVPGENYVVLGSSNPDTECYEQRCKDAGIPVLRRYGGGGAVILHPGCVILSLGLWVDHPYKNDLYFRWINEAFADCLRERWPGAGHIAQRGISDLAVGERKIAGTSLFRSRNYLLYQASLLVEARADLMEEFLAYPGREPDYRRGKSHTGFVSGLSDLVPGLSPDTVCEHLRGNFLSHLRETSETRKIPSQKDQWGNLHRRLKRSGHNTPHVDSV